MANISNQNQVTERNASTQVHVVNPDTGTVIIPRRETEIVNITAPGPQGIPGEIGPQGISAPFNDLGSAVWSTTASIQVTGSFTVSGSSTFTNIGPAVFSGSVTINGADAVTTATVTSLTAATASYAVKAASVDTLNQTVTIAGNLNVIGTASFTSVTASNVTVGASVITLNTDNPSVRFGGLTVVDSGSFGTSSTGSLFWDSLNNRWIYSNPSGSSYDGGMLISGPRNTSGLGNEVGTTANALMKGQGGDHITSSGIFEVSGNVGIGTNTPAYPLHITRDTTNNYIQLSGNTMKGIFAEGSGLIAYDTAGNLGIYTGGVNLRSTFSSTGNLGIGTSTPVASLHISASSSSALLRVESNASSSILFVTGSGIVGVKTSTPSIGGGGVVLDVNGNVRINSIIEAPGDLTIRPSSNNNHNIVFSNYLNYGTIVPVINNSSRLGTPNLYWQEAYLNKVAVGTGTTPLSASLHIRGLTTSSLSSSLLIQNAAVTTSFVVKDNGNIGVGTFTPAALMSLQVPSDNPGDIFTIRNRAGGYDKLALGWSANGYNSYFGFGGGSGFYLHFINNANSLDVMMLHDQGPVQIGSQAGSRLAVQKNAAPTSSTIGSSYFLVDMGYAGGGLGAVGTIAYGASAYAHPSAYISYLNQSVGDFGRGALLFGMRATSSADNPATEYMRLTNSGNFLIGSQTDAGYRLDVSGSFRTTSTASFGGLAVFNQNRIDDVSMLNFDTTNNYYQVGKSGTDLLIRTAANNLLFFGGKDTTLQTGVIGGHFYFKGGNVNGFGQSNFSIADYNGSNTRFFVSGSGNVGIGTTTPSENLQVSGSILVGQYASSTSLLKFANVTNAGNSAYIGQTAAAGFEIQPGSVNEFRINTPAGTDTAALTIFGNGVKTAQFYRNSRTRFGGNLSTNPGSTVEIVGEGATSATTALRVQNSSATPSLVVLDNGFVGIGTGSADFNLDVNGSTRVKGAGATGSTNAFVVQNSAGNNALIVTNGLTTNVQGDLQLENSVLYWNAGSQIRNISNGVLRITNSSNSDFTRLQFGGGTTAFPALQRVSASIAIVDATGGTSGSLLVGTITDAGYKLDVNGTTRVSGLLTLSAGASITGNVSIGSANFISAARYQCSTSLFNFGTTFLYGAGGQDGGTITTGSRTIFLSDANWTQSSGNADFSSFRVTGTINQTGTADGITRGLYIAPTLTAAANFRAIETTAGNVLFQSGSTSLMTVSSSGNVTIPSNLSVGLTDTYGRFNLRGSDNLGATRTMTVQSADQTLLFQMYNNGTTMLNPQGAGTVLVGTSVASGANLQVRGKGATSATTALRVENTNATASLVVRDDGSTLFAGSNGVAGTWVDDTGSLTIYRSNFGTIYGLKVYNGAGWIGHNAIHAIAYQYPIYGLQGSNGAEFASPLNAGAGVYGRGGVGVYGNGVTPAGDSGSIGVMATSLYVQSAGNTALYNRSASAHIIGTSIFSGNMTVTGSVRISGSSALTVIGSGSALPIFTVQGSQGELFSIVDSLSGSLFSVNDISGLPILEVFSDGTTLIGDYQDPALITTTKKTANTGITTIYSLPTASYDSAWFDYTIRSGSDARVGTIMGMWSGTSVNYAETSASQFGNTGGFTFGMSISGSNMILSGSATTSGWTVKTIIRSI